MGKIRVVTSPLAYYTGPYFDLGDASEFGLGHKIATLRQACSDWHLSTFGHHLPQTDLARCILNNLEVADAANAASHTYFLTLWPAFVSIIVAFGPDGGQIAYDNVFWAGIFTLSSGAIPGHKSLSLPHHFEAPTLKEAQAICGYWQDDESNARKSSRRGKLRSGMYASEKSNLALVFACVSLWAGFVVWYWITLRKAMYYSFDLPPFYGIMWYVAGAGSVVFKGILRLGLHNVELWEPIQSLDEPRPTGEVSGNTDESIDTAQSTLTKSPPANQQPVVRHPNFTSFPRFSARKFRTGFQTWFRIVYLQLTRQGYRILVRPAEPAWLDAGVQYSCHMIQLSLFVWGCMVQGGISFLDTPTDYYLTVLLVFATATPRLLWPRFWRTGRSGADLVVWYKPAF